MLIWAEKQIVRTSSVAKSKIKGTAPGQYLGYALQSVRLFYHLITCDQDAAVGLEYADDVSVHNGSEARLLEQCKSALSQNPVSDWAIDLWKTFSNWVENVQSGAINPTCTNFRLYVTPVKSAKLAQRLSDAKSEDEITSILKGVAQKRLKLKKPPACDQHIQTVLSASPAVLTSIFRNFVLENEITSPIDQIYGHLDATISPAIAEQACKWGIGHAKELVDAKISNGEEPLISAQEFRRSFRAFIAKYDIARVLRSISDDPGEEMIQVLISTAPKFVKQLELVDANAEIKTRAASDFLRASADRTLWAEEGLVFEDSCAQYDDLLKRRHQNLKGELEISHALLPEKKRGLLLYYKCCGDVPIGLQGREVPSHFMPGCYNAIADRLEIGWHPQYSDLLKGAA